MKNTKGFAVFPVIFIGVAIVTLIIFGYKEYKANQRQFGAIPSSVSSSTNINQLYGQINNLVEITTSSSRPLGVIASLSSSTGNIIVGSSSNWIAKTVGANGTFLGASSTAQGGVDWISLGTLAGNNVWTGTNRFSDVVTFATTTFFTGEIGSSASSAVRIWTTNLNFTNATGTTLSLTNGTGFLRALTVSSTAITFTNATGSNKLTVGYLDVSNGDEFTLHTASISIQNPTSTAHSTGTVVIYFPNKSTILRVECYSTKAGTSTLILDRVATSTPTTAGTRIMEGLGCGATTGTTTFASSTMTAGSLLSINIASVGAPSSTEIGIQFKVASSTPP